MADSLSQILAWKSRAARLRQAAAEARPTSSGTEIARRRLLDFVPALSPKFSRPDHLAPLVDLIERSELEAVRACVGAPPRHGKTESLLHGFAWRLARNPSLLIAYTTYAADLAHSKSRDARDYAIRAGVILRGDSNSVHEWRTPQGGGLVAVGVGGVLTGHGFGLIVVDDPFANRQEAESPTVRQQRHEWFTSTVETRLEPGGSALVTHTRWHPDDLTGRLVEGITPDRHTSTPWPNIRLPALSEDGVPLWPARWPRKALEAKRDAVGPYDWSSLYQQEPRPRGGQLFGEPARYGEPDLDGVRLVIVCDPAASEKTHADFSAIGVFAFKGFGPTLRADVLRFLRVQVAIPQLVRLLRELQTEFSCPVVVEAVGGFKAVPQMLRDLDPTLNVAELQPALDKFVRAQPAAGAWNAGRIRLPVDAVRHPWVATLLAEARVFTGIKDPHDDQVDVISHAWTWASKPQDFVGTLEPEGWIE